jgi:uncharacterized membrane protein
MENTQLTTMFEAHIAQGIEDQQAPQPAQQRRRKSRINVGANERALSVLGGSMLAAFGLRRGGWAGTALAALGGELIWRGATGHCVGYESLGIDRMHGSGPVRVSEVVRINRPSYEIYVFCRNFENLPRIMGHLESVTETGEGRSRWKAKSPAGQSVEWDVVMERDVPNEFVSWRSSDQAQISSRGSIRLTHSPVGYGTDAHIQLKYEPRAGYIDKFTSMLFGEEPEKQLRADLRRLKQILETGEVPTTKGQPIGEGGHATGK